jgi:outer membrane protein assembly factor BamA
VKTSICLGQIDSLQAKILSLADKKILIIPGVTYSPETNFVFGVASLYKLDLSWKDSTDRESYLRFAGSYSLNNQVALDLGYRIASKKERFVSFGEIGYSKYPNSYFGHGNEINYDTSERYTPQSLRLRFNGLYRINKFLSIGPRYQFDNYYSVDKIKNGILDSDEILGKEGGMSSGLGYIITSDRRNSIFIPSKGYYAIFRNVFFRNMVGSDFDFTSFEYDIRKYIPVRKKHVLALQHYGEYTMGDVPFYELPSLGGSYRMRGHFTGAYREKNITMFQADFRYRLSKYFVWSTFGGVGWLNKDASKFHWPDNRISIGTGIRFYTPSSGLAFRFDYAFARENSGFYIGLGEAF